ncbi:uncharacterized protein [Choristoneura fumiferana]|uniref:uncharacterized protein n=1 Tax=Choristoneura fumiferana TaxID=7141 RepID=UPI003D15C54F
MPIGKLYEFDLASGRNWPAYVRLVEQFILLNDIDNELRVATLVTHVGAATYQLMCDLCTPSNPENNSFEDLVKLVNDHLEPQRSEIAERYTFRQRRQADGETIAAFLQNLKHLATHCNFGTELEVNIRDQFVCGLRSDEMRSRLFVEPSLSYKKAVELALSLEAAERHAAEAAAGAALLGGGGEGLVPGAAAAGLHRVGARAPPDSRRRRGGSCWRCGKGTHSSNKCRYKSYVCDMCHEKGHLSGVCPKNEKNGDRSSAATVHAPHYRCLLLTTEDRLFWADIGYAAYAAIKQALTREPVLAHYDSALPLVLAVDSSSYGLGAVLAHVYSDGSERVVCCASRTLTDAECKYMPSALRANILEEVHAGHMGVVRMKQMARNYVWWPSIDQDIENRARSCSACAAERDAPPRAPPTPYNWPSEPWTRLHADFLQLRGKYYFLIIDAHSKWLEVFPMSSGTTASLVTAKLRDCFARFGLPKQLVTDGGPPFTSEEFEKFLKRNGVSHVITAAYHPASNGAAENAVKTVKKALKKAAIDGEDMERALSKFLLQYRNAAHTTTQCEPTVAMLGRRVRTRLDLLRGSTADRVADAQRTQLRHAGGTPRAVAPGDHVLVRDFSKNTQSKWTPGIVTERTGTVTYNVQTSGGVSHKHIDQIIGQTRKPNRYSIPNASCADDTAVEDEPPVDSSGTNAAQTDVAQPTVSAQLEPPTDKPAVITNTKKYNLRPRNNNPQYKF